MVPVMPDMLFKGKVRDTYPSDEPEELVVVASDRISVFDVVLPDEIPGKGKVLTHMTEHWLNDTPVGGLMPNHFRAGPRYDTGFLPNWAPEGRSLLVQKLNMLPVEAIVRGYLTGSGWKEYQKTGKVSGIELPAGMQEMAKFPAVLFTPSTKAADGEHDENIDFERMEKILEGQRLAEEVRDMSLAIYEAGAKYALERGIILVDTKFEFGLDPVTEELVLADEVLTPDSSRYVREEDYVVGKPPVSMDKQIVRDWAKETGWDKTPPAPSMPQPLIDKTSDLYGETALRLTGINPLAE
jgi:phosphoribosylaminoimidazole-succinocarboxamide synthase